MRVLESRQIKATRKPWQCDGCGRKFEAGTSKERQRIVGEDGPYTWEWCLTCRGLGSEFPTLYGDDMGITPDNLLESMQEQFGSWEAADAKFMPKDPATARIALLEGQLRDVETELSKAKARVSILERVVGQAIAIGRMKLDPKGGISVQGYIASTDKYKAIAAWLREQKESA